MPPTSMTGTLPDACSSRFTPGRADRIFLPRKASSMTSWRRTLARLGLWKAEPASTRPPTQSRRKRCISLSSRPSRGSLKGIGAWTGERCLNFRASNADGTFTKRPLSTSEASDMLNDFLEIMGTDDETTSHSLKSTTLVWCARYGLGDKERAMLGHHAIKENSMACYSRDLLAGPRRLVE